MIIIERLSKTAGVSTSQNGVGIQTRSSGHALELRIPSWHAPVPQSCRKQQQRQGWAVLAPPGTCAILGTETQSPVTHLLKQSSCHI